MTPSTSPVGQTANSVGARADGTGLSSSIEPASGLAPTGFDPSRVSDVLDAAAELLSKPGAWTRGALARNAGGQVTGLSGYRGPAVCWCAMGATETVAGEGGYDISCEADAVLACILPGGDVAAWNDAPERTQAEVVAKFREAAALARSEGK